MIDIDLPDERSVETRESDRYFRLVTRVREALRQDESGDDDRAAIDAERVRAEGLA